MAWLEQEVRVWGWCKKWGIPYPCRKIRRRFCCVGNHKEICVGFIAKHWHCCDGRQSSWWSGCFGAGKWLTTNVNACRKSIPNESEGCPDVVGDVLPGFSTEVYAVVLGALVGGAISAGSVTIASSPEYVEPAAMAGALIGGTIGATSHRPAAGILLILLELLAFRVYLPLGF